MSEGGQQQQGAVLRRNLPGTKAADYSRSVNFSTLLPVTPLLETCDPESGAMDLDVTLGPTNFGKKTL